MNSNIAELELKSGNTGEELELFEDVDEDEAEEDDDANQNKFQEAYEQRKQDGEKLKQDFEGSRQ